MAKERVQCLNLLFRCNTVLQEWVKSMSKNTTPHSLLTLCQERTLQLKAEVLRLYVKQDYAGLVEACVNANGDMRSGLLVLMATSRNPALMEAAEAGGLLPKLGGQISQDTYLYLWSKTHDDFMWMCDYKPVWKQQLSKGMPWKIILAERFHQPEWTDDLDKFLFDWEPGRMNKYPHALKYMKNPTERHVLEAACAKDGAYMKPEQIDALRPGASAWFKVRKELGIEETPAQAKHAFRTWWRMGAVQQLEGLDEASLFSGETP